MAEIFTLHVMRQNATATRVLIVDNNPDAANILKMLIELDGYDVSVAYTGEAGLSELSKSRPDIILCDIYLPVLTELEFARQVRRMPESCRATLVSLDGANSRIAPSEFFDAGFDHLMKKQSFFKDARHALRTFLPDAVR